MKRIMIALDRVIKNKREAFWLGCSLGFSVGMLFALLVSYINMKPHLMP